MKTTSTFLAATSVAGLVWAVACAGKVGHHRSGSADGGGAGQNPSGASDDAGSSNSGGTAGTGGRAASSGTGGRLPSTGGRAASSGTGGRLPSTGGHSFADAGTTGGGTGGATGTTGGTPSGGVEIGTGGIATGGVEPSAGGVAAGGVQQSTGGNAAMAGAAGSPPEPPFRIPNEASACGGFSRTLSGGSRGSPSNGELPADDYCDASVLRWACNSYATGLWVQLTRLEFQCCADLHVSLVPEADGYRLSVLDNSEKLCNCICVFDAQAFVERPCEPTTILWDALSLALPVADNSSGEEIVSDEPSSFCEPLEAGSSDEIAQALAGTTAILEVTRTWLRTADLVPVDAEYAAVDDAPAWTIVFSDDGSAVTVSETGSEFKHYTGTRVEGDPLGYDLSGGTGGELWIVPYGTGYSAEITLYGSGLPFTQSVLGELTLGGTAWRMSSSRHGSERPGDRI